MYLFKQNHDHNWENNLKTQISTKFIENRRFVIFLFVLDEAKMKQQSKRI